jgi:hypothetical protein
MQRVIMPGTRKITLSAMLGAFTLLFLYLASIVPAGKLAFYFLSSVFIAGLVVEHETGYAFLMFVAVALLSFLIIPNRVRVLYYVLFFGHYGIGKHYIEKIRDKITAFILKLLYFNAAVALIYVISLYILGQNLILQDVGFSLPIVVLILIAQVVFVVYDYLYSLVTQYYYQKIRKWLMKTGRQSL